MSIRNKIFLGLIFSAILPLLLVTLTVFPFHSDYLMDREISLMTASSQNRVTRTEAVLKGTGQETLQQIADHYPQLGESPEVLILARNAENGRFAPVTTPRFAVTRPFPDEAMQAFLEDAMKDHEPHSTTLIDQRDVSAVMIGRRVGDTDHVVVVKKNREEILRPHGVLRDYFLMLAFIAIAMAAMLALMLTRTVTAPLVTLSRAVAKFRTDTPITINAVGNDEVSSLARSFQGMWARVRDYHNDLEKEVKKRTAELEEAKLSLENSNKTLAAKLEEIQKLNALMIGRELKMVELKQEVKKIKGEADKK